MIHDQTLARQALLFDGELKRTAAFINDHTARVDFVRRYPDKAKVRDNLELAAFCSAYYQTVERLFKILFGIYEIEVPSTLQHHEALIDAAQRAHKNVPGLIPPEAVPGVRKLCRFHYRTRRLKPEELELNDVVAHAGLVLSTWEHMQPWYKELYYGWHGRPGL